MKYVLLIFLYDPSGEFLLKDVVDAPTRTQCESMVASYAKTLINSQKQMSFFCLTEEEYYNRESDTHTTKEDME